MKQFTYTIVIGAAVVVTSSAFIPLTTIVTRYGQHHTHERHVTSILQMSREEGFNRRRFMAESTSLPTTAATIFAGSIMTFPPKPAFAFGYGQEYTPRFDDVKVLLSLGMTLDNLISKVSDENRVGSALDGLVSFNKSPSFYPDYARNYIGKSVKQNASDDPRVGFIRQASNLISSCQSLLEGREGKLGKDASNEAVKRVKKAQSLIAKFLKDSGVEDERVAKYVAEHS